jgi:hypothetical protein
MGLSSWLMELFRTRGEAPDALTSLLFSPEPKKILELGPFYVLSLTILTALLHQEQASA